LKPFDKYRNGNRRSITVDDINIRT